MPSLVEQLGKEPLRAQAVNDCVDLIDAQVKEKGIIIKGAYSTIKAIKKRFVPEVVDSLLDDWPGSSSRTTTSGAPPSRARSRTT